MNFTDTITTAETRTREIVAHLRRAEHAGTARDIRIILEAAIDDITELRKQLENTIILRPLSITAAQVTDMIDAADSNLADLIVQTALFGNIVYG